MKQKTKRADKTSGNFNQKKIIKNGNKISKMGPESIVEIKSDFKVCIAQINSSLGDFKGNAFKIVEIIQQAKLQNARLVVFPECALFGYHPFDLLERADLVNEQLKYLKWISQKIPSGISALIGHISINKKSNGRPYHNSSALVSKNKIEKVFHKELLPTGDVFDEGRFIQPGSINNNIFKIDKCNILLTICEDIWAWPDSSGRSIYENNPIQKLKNLKFDLIINQSASPFFKDKIKLRKSVASQTAKSLNAPVLYCNMVGAQDEIIYDGGSFVVLPNGETIMQSSQFQEDINYFKLKQRLGGIRPIVQKKAEVLRRALVLGIKDFCFKTGISKVHLGLSGGIDSAVVVSLAVDALGPKNVQAIYLPSQFSSNLSQNLASQLCENLGIKLIEFPIEEIFEKMNSGLQKYFKVEGFGLTQENIQARIRGTLLMAFSNFSHSMLLNTSNKSEFAAGYSTLYGDMCGGLCPIGDLTKKEVYLLADHYNSEWEVIPQGLIDRAPSAELRPNQKDTDSLPEYEVLDRAVENLVENSKTARSNVEKWLIGAIQRSEFKRWQAPPILKISKHSFGRGRRFPIANCSKTHQ